MIRRDVQWLTASRESSVSFTPLHELDGIITPNGLCFERHHGGIAEIDPEDYRLIVHGLVDKPLMLHARRPQALPARQPHLLPRMRGEFRHGMARRAAQRLPIHPRHGALRRIHRRAAADAARGGGPEDQRELAARRGRRLRRHDALDPACQGARRLPRRLPHERRDAASRAGLSGAPRGAGLGRQCLGQVAAPAQARRRSRGSRARRRRNTPT